MASSSSIRLASQASVPLLLGCRDDLASMATSGGSPVGRSNWLRLGGFRRTSHFLNHRNVVTITRLTDPRHTASEGLGSEPLHPLWIGIHLEGAWQAGALLQGGR